jgi:hypothetical protein
MPRLASQIHEGNHPKFLTKSELREAAMTKLKVSKNPFDFAWILALEDTGRHDWCGPSRRRLASKLDDRILAWIPFFCSNFQLQTFRSSKWKVIEWLRN